MMTILDQQGNSVQIYATERDGFVDTCIRATDRATWVQAALSQNLLYQEPIYEKDQNTGEATIVGYNDEIKASAGANISEIGPAVISTAVVDSRFHLNMRIAEPLLSKVDASGYPLWKATALLWMNVGQDVTQVNNQETAKVVSGVEMIDPDSIVNPDRVWF